MFPQVAVSRHNLNLGLRGIPGKRAWIVVKCDRDRVQFPTKTLVLNTLSMPSITPYSIRLQRCGPQGDNRQQAETYDSFFHTFAIFSAPIPSKKP